MKTKIDAYFSPEGPVAKAIKSGHYAPRPEQVAMSEKIQACMEKADELRGESTAILPIEGDTGIGKTLAMLIPMLHQVAIHREKGEQVRCGYATFTTQLRRQVAEKDLPVAIEAVANMTGISLEVAEYWGANQYLSREALLQAEKETSSPVIPKILEWLERPDSDGLIISAKADLGIEEHEPLVDGRLDSAWSCTWREAKDLQSYQTMRENIRQADVLLLSHAAALVNANRWFSLFDEKMGKDETGKHIDNPTALRYVVFDEAHKLPDAARSFTDRGFSLRRMVSILENAESLGVGRVNRALVDRFKSLEESAEKAGGQGHNDRHAEVTLVNQLAPCGDGSTVREILQKAQIVDLQKDLESRIKHVHRKSLSQDAAMAFLDLQDLSDWLKDYLEAFSCTKGQCNPYQIIPALSWSPVFRWPSLRMSTANPGRMAARYWRHYPGTAPLDEVEDSYLWGAVLLSATLPALGELGLFNEPKTPLDESALGWQKRPHLMIPDVNDCPHFEPEHFGTMQFVLSGDSPDVMLKEKSDEKEGWVNPDWERTHLFPMIDVMMEQLQPHEGAMILTPAGIDVEKISDYGASRPWASRIIAQGKGDTLAAKSRQFLAHPGSVLLSAGGWEGLDLPGRIQHLMICRLPYPPLNEALKEILMAKHDDEGKVWGIIQNGRQREMLAKMRHGIGRGIRQKEDQVTVWIADKRFGLPEGIRMMRDPRTQKSQPAPAWIQHAVPTRFFSALNKARVFTASEKLFTPEAAPDAGLNKSLGNGVLKQFFKKLG